MRRNLIVLLVTAAFFGASCGNPPDSRLETPQVASGQDLIGATQRNDDAAVRKLLDEGADVNSKTDTGVTALMAASGIGNKEIVELLLARGADVNLKTPGNYTALMSAALVGQSEIVRVLLDAGADPTVKDIGGRTAAAYAKEKGHQDIVDMLSSRK